MWESVKLTQDLERTAWAARLAQLIRLGRSEFAEAELNQYVALYPQDGWGAVNLAYCQLLNGRPRKELLPTARLGVRLNPDDDWAVFVLAQCEAPERFEIRGLESPAWSQPEPWYLRRSWRGALRRIDEAIRLNPEVVIYYRFRAIAEAACGRLKSAEASMRSALALDLEDANSAAMLSALLRQTGRDADARRLMKAMVAVHPEDPAVRLELGQLDLSAGRASATHFATALRGDPHSANAQVGLRAARLAECPGMAKLVVFSEKWGAWWKRGVRITIAAAASYGLGRFVFSGPLGGPIGMGLLMAGLIFPGVLRAVAMLWFFREPASRRTLGWFDHFVGWLLVGIAGWFVLAFTSAASFGLGSDMNRWGWLTGLAVLPVVLVMTRDPGRRYVGWVVAAVVSVLMWGVAATGLGVTRMAIPGWVLAGLAAGVVTGVLARAGERKLT